MGLKMEDEKDETMCGFAQDLIKKSAVQASARLQFARLAFGAAGSAGASIDTGDAEQVARGFIQDDRTTLVWTAPRVLLPKNQVKLLLYFLLIAQTAVPRGGSIEVIFSVEGEQGRFKVVSKASTPASRTLGACLAEGRAGEWRCGCSQHPAFLRRADRQGGEHGRGYHY